MKNKELLDAVSSISEKYIDEAAPGGRRTYVGVLEKIAAVAACFCIIAGVSLSLAYFLKEPYDHGKVTGSVAGSISEMGSETENLPTDTEIDTGDTDETKWYPVIGGTPRCRVHHKMYHSIYGGLIEYVGAEKYSEWVSTLKIDETKINSDTECPNPKNIKLFIDEFKISKEEFAENCNLVLNPEYDLNVLYSKTPKEVDEYYRDISQFKTNRLRSVHYQYLKDEIIERYKEDTEKLGLGIGKLNMMSVPDLVIELNIGRSELEGMIENAEKICTDLFGICYTYEYDFDTLYVNTTSGDISSNELNEMFCRVGRYAE